MHFVCTGFLQKDKRAGSFFFPCGIEYNSNMPKENDGYGRIESDRQSGSNA